MVRTKADRVPSKAVGSKAPQKSVKSSTPSKKTSTGSKAKSYSGGNPYHPRDTPEWQKPITCFLNQNPSEEPASSLQHQKETVGEGSSKQAECESD